MEWMGEVFGDDFMVEVGVVGEGGLSVWRRKSHGCSLLGIGRCFLFRAIPTYDGINIVMLQSVKTNPKSLADAEFVQLL